MASDNAKREALKAYISGSLNDMNNQIRSAVTTKFNQNPLVPSELWVEDIIPDTPIASGKAILQDWDNAKFYEVSFTQGQNGLELGEPSEVMQQTQYVAAEKIGLVYKDEAKRLVTAPVLLPECPDCDFKRGEKIFTVEEVEDLAHKYNQFRMADQMHIYGATGQVVGEAVENWTLKNDETVENILGETVTLPKGTWMATIKVTDDSTWKLVEDGTYKGFSGTFIPEKDANLLLESLQANKCKCVMDAVFKTEAAKSRTLIADLENPVPVTISLVTTPCVPNAIFTSVKSAEKAGRTISNSTLGIFKKMEDSLSKGLNELRSLLNKAEEERADPLGSKANKFYVEVENMDEKEFNEKVGKAVEPIISAKFDEIKELLQAKKEDEPEAEEPEAKKEDAPKEETVEAKKEDAPAEEPEAKKEDSESDELAAIKADLEALKTENAQLKEKLGVPTESNKIAEPEETKPKSADKGFYAEAGLDISGRPLPKG